MTISLTAVGPGLPQKPTADAWFGDPIQDVVVTTTGPFSPTADGACPVEMAGGHRAFIKPRPDAARNLVVAREKIASDLAYLLGLPVAPVIVRRPSHPDWQFHSAISLAVLPSARQWGSGGHGHLHTVAERLEGLRVFWTWIGDNDHAGHPGNLLFAVGPQGCDILAIDHSYSMCHGNQNTSLDVGVSPGYGSGGMAEAPVWARATADKILSLDWDRVQNVVQRLQPILTPEEQNKILRILKDRRDHLPTFFGF